MICTRALLVAALLAASSAASAAPTVYGLSFIGTDVYVERPDEPLRFTFPRDFTGTFTYDSATSQLLDLDAEFTGPFRDFTAAAVNLLETAQPCDLACFVEALESGSFQYYYLRSGATVTFGEPLDGSASVSSVATYSRPFYVTGRIQFNGAVPEPDAWLMMLLGFGAIGTSMRRRKHAGAKFAAVS